MPKFNLSLSNLVKISEEVNRKFNLSYTIVCL